LASGKARFLSGEVKAGVAHSPEEAVDQAERAVHSSAIGGGPVHRQVDNLADLFARSPFRGLDMDFEPDQDVGRDVSFPSLAPALPCLRFHARTGAAFLASRRLGERL
jgi:hypothetical protein